MDKLFENVGKTRGIAITILDMFEDMLADKEIIIPDVAREGDEDEACLYGETYFELEDKITELLCEFIDE
jgi:hypothetical protein